MSALYYIVIFIFVLICLLLVGIILMQSSKTGGMGAGIGGNAALSTAFGGQGADKLLVKITTVLASIFMVLAIALNILSSPNDDVVPVSSKSIMQGSNAKIEKDALNDENQSTTPDSNLDN